MHDELRIDPLRKHRRNASPSPETVVLELYASLRGTAAYVALLLDRIDMASIPEIQLDRAPADVPVEALLRLHAISEALHAASDAVLVHIDPQLARRAWAAADVDSQTSPGDRCDR